MRMKQMRLYVNLGCLLILLIFTDYSCAKGGRGGGFGRSSSSSSWSSRSRPSPSYSRPSPSYSRPSPSYTYSAPSPSYSKPSPSYGWNVGGITGSTATGSKPPSYGWNVGSSSTNTGSKPSNTNYGWNVGNTKPSAPVGPPPSYPGLQSRPVPSHNSPPAYSPSYHNPPSYSPSHTVYSPSSFNSPTYNRPSPSYGTSGYVNRNTYSTYGSNPGYNPYGNTFGSHGLGGNTYISNNYYGNQGGSRGSGFLTNALFYGAGMHSGYHWGHHSSYNSYHNDYNRRRGWNEEEDRNWRATTQATYFANKVPGEEKILPASAVIGAATAFGLVSLLPLNVPASKPIMYCNNSTDLMQAQIKINNQTLFQCINGTIEITCMKNTNETKVELEATTQQMSSTESISTTPAIVPDSEITTEQMPISGNETSTEPASTTQVSVKKESKCESMKAMPCDVEVSGYYYCSNGTLFSKESIFCNSTTFLNGTNLNETIAILNCYVGEVPESQAAFIPTTTAIPPTTTEKSLSFAAKAHLFFLKLIGQEYIPKTQKPTPTPVPEEIPQLSAKDAWVPEALTIPPEPTTTTTTEAPFVWMEKTIAVDKNGNKTETLKPVSSQFLYLNKVINELKTDNEFIQGLTVSDNWVKVYITTTPILATNDSTSEMATSESTTKIDKDADSLRSSETKTNIAKAMNEQNVTVGNGSFVWMQKVGKYDENGYEVLKPAPKDDLEMLTVLNRILVSPPHAQEPTIPSNWIRVYIMTAPSYDSTTEATKSLAKIDEEEESGQS